MSKAEATTSDWRPIDSAPEYEGRDVTYETPFGFREGPAVAYDDETGKPLHLVWYAYLGGGMSETTHWMPLPPRPA